MNSNTSFWIIFAAITLWGTIHSLLASLKAKAMAERWFGRRFNSYYQISFVLIALITVPLLLGLVVLLPDQQLYTIPLPWIIATGLLQILGGLMVLVGLWQTGAMNFLGIPQALHPGVKLPSQLVTGGVYRWVRHPLYTGSLVFIWLMPMMSTNILAFNIAATLYLVIGTIFEERKLLFEFGDAYHEYQQRTPTFIPFIRCKR
jgi:methanethiol S-methyltransferase